MLQEVDKTATFPQWLTKVSNDTHQGVLLPKNTNTKLIGQSYNLNVKSFVSVGQTVNAEDSKSVKVVIKTKSSDLKNITDTNPKLDIPGGYWEFSFLNLADSEGLLFSTT